MKRYKNKGNTIAKPIFSKPTTLNTSLPPAQDHQSTYSNKGESMIGGIMSNVVQGAALGTGSQLASRSIDAIIGPRKIETVSSLSGSGDNNCLKEHESYISCMRNGDAEQCKNLFELLDKCKNINI